MTGRVGHDIDRAAGLLDDDGVVGYPTDTLYGLGARIDRPEALDRIFQIKGRPVDVPLTVAVAAVEDVKSIATITESARRLLPLLPGPLTLVLARRDAVPDIVTAGGATVGIRVPDDPTARDLLARTGPLTATSANRHGEPPAHDASTAHAALGDRVDYYVAGRSTALGTASTVVDCTDQAVRILREGALSASKIQDRTTHAR